MVRALEHEPVVALQFAVVGGVKHVEIIAPTARVDRRQHATDCFVDEFVLDVCHRVDLAHVVGGQRARHPLRRCLIVGDECAVVPHAPVARLVIEHSLTLRGIFDVSGRKIEIFPVDATQLRLRRVPRVVRVGETHPAEPVRVGGQRAEPRNRLVGHPLGVIPLARNLVVFHLRRTGVAATARIHLQLLVEHLEEHRCGRGILLAQPSRIVERPESAVRGEREVLESAVRRGQSVGADNHLGLEPARADAVLGETQERIDERLEVRLADQRGSVSRTAQVTSDARCVGRQRNAVHPHAVRAHVLAGEHRATRRHAHHVLRMRAVVDDAVAGERIYHGGARDAAAVAAERVVTLLVGGDEENFAAHQSFLLTRVPRFV